MIGRRLLVVLGLALFGVAVVDMAGAGVLPVPGDEGLVYGVAGAVLLYAYLVYRASTDPDGSRTETPDPEVAVPTPPPGQSFERVLDRFRSRTTVSSLTRTKAGLRAAAVATLARYEDCDEAEARRRIENGTWTTDRRAAAFLREDDESRPAPITNRLRDRLRSESAYQRDLRHTVDAIADVAGLATSNEDGRSNAAADDGGIEPTTTERSPVHRETHRWTGVSLVALVGLGVGLLVEQPAVLLAGTVGVGYAAYARATAPGTVDLSVERAVSDADPDPGDDVEVTLTVTNEGERFLPDVRLVDGVPPALAVTEGSPRCGTALRAGASTSFSYTVTARRGRHAFRPTLVVARNLPGSIEREVYVTAAATLTCVPSLRPTEVPVPLRTGTTQYTGAVETDIGGEGLEFYATRRYRPGDPITRIDWHRRARTGDLATLEFRQERAAVVVLVVDVRASAYVSPEPTAAHAVDRSVEAARQVFARLLDDGHQVGVTTMGSADCWLPPGAGSDHRVRGRRLLATDPALSSQPPETDDRTLRWRRRLRRRLPSSAQVIVFSPLCDPLAVRTVRRLDADGHPATVVSPDPTTDRTLGHRLSRVRRTVATTDLRRAGIPVFDWQPTDSLEAVLATARGGSTP